MQLQPEELSVKACLQGKTKELLRHGEISTHELFTPGMSRIPFDQLAKQYLPEALADWLRIQQLTD